MAACQGNVGTARNLVSAPLRGTRWLFIGSVMWGAIKVRNLPIGIESEAAYQTVFENKEVCYSEAFVGLL